MHGKSYLQSLSPRKRAALLEHAQQPMYPGDAFFPCQACTQGRITSMASHATAQPHAPESSELDAITNQPQQCSAGKRLKRGSSEVAAAAARQMGLKQLLSQERDKFIEERSLDAKQPDMELIPKSNESEVHHNTLHCPVSFCCTWAVSMEPGSTASCTMSILGLGCIAPWSQILAPEAA